MLQPQPFHSLEVPSFHQAHAKTATGILNKQITISIQFSTYNTALDLVK